MVNVFMKRDYIYPITEVNVYVHTSVLCASGDSNDPAVVSVDPNPVNNTVIE